MIHYIEGLRPSDEAEPIPPIRIARMRLEDIEHVSRIERKCYALPWSSSAYVTELGNPKAYYTVAKTLDGVIVGYGGMWTIMDEAHLTTIAVDPEWRGMRIGERLLLDMLEHGMSRGATRSTLEVREHNRAAHGLYLKWGFIDVAVRRNYYSDNGENAVIMWQNDLYSREFLTALREFKRDVCAE
jgi:[ribosomal protein S18]-alanine N-acetyltransferase